MVKKGYKSNYMWIH